MTERKVEEWKGPFWTISISTEKISVRKRKWKIELDHQSSLENLELKKGLVFDKLAGISEKPLRLAFVSSGRNREISNRLRLFVYLPWIAETVSWHSQFQTLKKQAVASGRWISTEPRRAIVGSRPRQGLFQRLRKYDLLGSLLPFETDAIEFLEVDHHAALDLINESILQDESEKLAEFFEGIESQPLSDEQVRSVITFDNRVQLVAAAGSGKTSVMVARAAYAVKRGFVRPEEILLLAFNKAAARELQERVEDRFRRAGISSHGVRATTFHSFGLSLIGELTGRKPRLAPWVADGLEEEHLASIVERLKTAKPEFAVSWEAYRLLLASAPTGGPEDGDPQWWNKDLQRSEFFTFENKRVKSYGELLIANWLFLNHVEFEYEKKFDRDLVTSKHGEYRPDFYYPSVDVWHEHWALDKEGNPPVDWKNYKRDMRWKRAIHVESETSLIETTWYEVVFGTGLSKLRTQLRKYGVEFTWDPDRVPKGAQVVDRLELVRLMRTFLSHVKSNRLSRHEIELRLSTTHSELAGFRTEQFLSLFWTIFEEWQSDLETSGYVDFDDMLISASELIEESPEPLGYVMVLVDEMQDSSVARARLVRSLLGAQGRYLLAVGDDWQSINRFAGSDLSVMTGFNDWFGEGPGLKLTRTFRSPSQIAEAASRFVLKNESQIIKEVWSSKKSSRSPIALVLVQPPIWDPDVSVSANREAQTKAIRESVFKVVDRIASEAEGKSESVLILGRYGFQSAVVPQTTWPNLDVRFMSVHASKGTEADHVVIVGLETGRYGFPSGMSDDPILDLAMPVLDKFPHSEERRLFYVALTRAKKSVVMLVDAWHPSEFAVEMTQIADVDIWSGEEVEVCPKCRKGLVLKRQGPNGSFNSCSRFPQCTG